MDIPEIIAALSFFGAVVICPLVYMLMRHQRTIAELTHRGSAGMDIAQRLDRIEAELRHMRSERHEWLIRADDARDLSTRG